MSLRIGLLLLLSAGTLAKDPPIPNRKESTVLTPRAVTYWAYHFPPREDFSSRAVLVNASLVRNHYFFDKTPYVYDKTTDQTVQSTTAINPAEVLVQDWPYQSTQEKTTYELVNRYFLTNPAFRQTEDAGLEICASSWQGHSTTKIVQILTEPGFPAQIPNLRCRRSTAGDRPWGAFVLSKRDFLSGMRLSERAELYKYETRNSSNAISYQAQLLHAAYRPLLNNFPNAAALLLSGQRDAGGQIWSKKSTYKTGTGRLQLSPLPTFLLQFDQWIASQPDDKQDGWRNHLLDNVLPWFGWGMTVQYGAWSGGNGDVPDSDIVVNVDTLLRHRPSNGPIYPREHVYNSYETWNSTWNLSSAQDKGLNLRLDISWEQWGCCSACCCNRRMCGELETSTKCRQVVSTRTRKGHLALMKLDGEKKVALKGLLIGKNGSSRAAALDEERKRLEAMFEVSPYRERGIPLYSTVIPAEFRTTIVQDHFEKLFLAARKWSTGIYSGLGQFIEKASCSSDRQKEDCFEWAKCHGVKLGQELESTSERPMERDVCTGVPFLTLTMDEWKNWFRLRRGRHYRLQLEEGIFETRRIVWRLGGRKVPEYRNNTPCHRQGMVSRGRLLLFTNNTKLDGEVQIEAELDSGLKVEAVLRWEQSQTAGEEEEDGDDNKLFWIIVGVSVGLILLLVAAVLVDWHVFVKGRRREDREQRDSQTEAEQ